MKIKSAHRKSSDQTKPFNRLPECEKASESVCQNCIIAKAIKTTKVWPNFLQERVLQQCHRGSMIFQEGTPVGFIYLLREGVVKISVEDQEGSNKVISIVSGQEASCEILDKLSLGRSTHSYTCEALSPCQLYCLPKATFNWLMKQEFELARGVLLTFSDDIEWFLNKIRSETSFSGRQRLAQLLLRLKKTPTGQKGKDNAMGLDLSRQELASLIGVTRETLTRLLGDLSKRGIIKVTSSQIFIKQQKQLSKIGANTQNEN